MPAFSLLNRIHQVWTMSKEVETVLDSKALNRPAMTASEDATGFLYARQGRFWDDQQFVKLCLEEQEHQFGIKSNPQPL